ncbi:MAG: 4-(cytidine 5'-diphospho)-2-C-methyl-D-erythritol kinase [Gammaproteobacteria bacterium]|nr:4-(cytidine 5'-diphospho)-2-C-methyl-D-erythritol kinase [Gammaproteobacteria bacterium]
MCATRCDTTRGPNLTVLPDTLPGKGRDKWLAPAKLNLFLHITGRRADGYHLLQTVFQFIEFYDQLQFSVREDGVICRQSQLVGIDEKSDLSVRAAKLLQTTANSCLGTTIQIEKNIPMGAGLGGGSSDAATTLIALNSLWQLGFSIERLAALGIELGADVPVFVRGHAAWAEGIGEQLTNIDLPEPWYLVIVPPCHVSTGEIFNAPELTRDAPPIKIRDFLSGQTAGQRTVCGNACEPVVRSLYPEINKVFEWLSEHARPKLTGTGTCVFAAFESEQSAEDIAQRLPTQWRGLVAKGINVSPLYTQASIR